MTGAFNTALILALFAVMALRPPIPRHASPFNLQFALGWWINEVPLVGLWWLISGTIGTLLHPVAGVWWWLVAVFAVMDVLMLGRIAVRAGAARSALSGALQRVYGPQGAPGYTRPAWWRFVLPIVSWRPDVRRVRNLRYGPARRGHRLDVYLSRRRRSGGVPAPVLVYFHSRLGSKMLGSRALIYRLAAHGWVCVSAGRRQFRASHGEQLTDTRAVLDWVRDNAATYGADPGRVIAVGGSAGAHLASTAAMTGSDVAAVVGLYGYYGPMDSGPGPTSPQQVISPDAPPFLIVHGTLDTLVPHQQARAFADRLRAVSTQPVVYAELPGAQHSFDVFPSLRFHAVTDAIVRFAQLTIGTDGTDNSQEPVPGTEHGQP